MRRAAPVSFVVSSSMEISMSSVWAASTRETHHTTEKHCGCRLGKEVVKFFTGETCYVCRFRTFAKHSTGMNKDRLWLQGSVLACRRNILMRLPRAGQHWKTQLIIMTASKRPCRNWLGSSQNNLQYMGQCTSPGPEPKMSILPHSEILCCREQGVGDLGDRRRSIMW